MEEIIKITEHDGKRAVNARDLHQFLENKREFATWMKQRIEQYEFVEGQDYVVFDKFVKNSNGGRPTIEYALTIDMAKELSMVENNEKGRMARKYFIECERKSKKETNTLDDKLKVIEFAARFLNMNDAGKLMMLKSVAEPLGLPTPDYVQSRGVHHSASELLRKHNAGMSVIKFNELLRGKGFLAETMRKGKTRDHRYNFITTKGREFGENVVSPRSPNETQPHWYDEKFDELLSIIK